MVELTISIQDGEACGLCEVLHTSDEMGGDGHCSHYHTVVKGLGKKRGIWYDDFKKCPACIKAIAGGKQ